MSSDRVLERGLPVLPGLPGLPVLTDEELLALGGTGGGGRFVIAPYLDALDSASRDVAQCVALRSLLARGVVAQLSAHEDGVVARLAPGVDRLLQLRERAETVVAIRRCVGVGGAGLGATLTYRHLHVLGSDVLLEDVDPAGLHRFAFLDLTEVAAELHAFLVPPGATPGRRALPAGAALDVLAAAHVVADIVVRAAELPGERPGERPEMRQIYLGPAGCYIDQRTDGSLTASTATAVPAMSEGGGQFLLEPIAPDDVAAWILSLTLMRGWLA